LSNFSIRLNCNTTSNTFTIDGSIKIGTSDGYDFYFQAFYLSNDAIYVINNWPVSYNSSTKVINFAGTYNGNLVFVGVLGYKSNQFAGFGTSVYPDIKMTLSSLTSSLVQERNAVVAPLQLKLIPDNRKLLPAPIMYSPLIKDDVKIKNTKERFQNLIKK